MSGVIRAYPPAPEADALRGMEYVIVDVETTGGSAQRGHRVTEVAALRVAADGTVLEELCTLVNPERPIPPYISALTNITGEMVKDAPRFRDILFDLATMLAGRVFVAHNAAFDWRFIRAEMERATGRTPTDGRILCTVRLARKLVPEVSSRSLDSLSDYFGIDNDARHRARGDALATAVLFGHLMERLEEREIASWSALDELLSRRKPRGKRRGPAMPTSTDSITCA